MARNGQLRSVDGLIAPAVAETLRNLPQKPEDAAARRLAERYARDLDDAAVVSATVTKALRELLHLDVEGAVELHDRFLTLATRIEETAVLASIGPKLLAVLESLGATPRARALTAKGGGSGAGTGKLGALRAAQG